MDTTDSRAISPSGFGPLAGDHSDDDGQAIDDILTPAEHGPVPYDTFLQPSKVEAIQPPSRVIVTSVKVGTQTTDPQQLLKTDFQRKNVVLYYYNETTPSNAALVTFGDSPTECYDDWNVIRLIPGSTVTLTDHTGPLWVRSLTANMVRIVAISVSGGPR